MNPAAQPSTCRNRHRSRMHRSVAGIGAPLCLAPTLAAPAAREMVGGPPADRVITLAPHATELVFAAGGGESIVGTVTSSDFPEEALAIPRIGDGIVLNQERIILLKPTLFVGWLRSGIALQIEALADR